MSLEEWKTYNVLREGARSIVRSRKPDLTPAEMEQVLDKLFEVCAEYKDPTELTACIYNNLERVAREVTGR